MNTSLEIAHSICTEVNAAVTSSNGIIPRTELPGLTILDIPWVKEKFGHQRCSQYLQHEHLLRSLRNQIADYSHQSNHISPLFSALIAITHFGVGESHELSARIFFELSKRGYTNAAFVGIKSPPYVSDIHPMPYVHCIVLLGEDINIRAGEPLSLFSELNDNVIIIDGLLNHVGFANRYLIEQMDYLDTFHYDQIHQVQVVAQDNLSQIPIIEENVKKLISFARTKGFMPYQRVQYSPCHETGLLHFLSANSGLAFHGVADESYRVDAIAKIRSPEDKATAKQIQARLGAGFFSQQAGRTLFTLPEINVNDNKRSEIIQRFYR